MAVITQKQARRRVRGADGGSATLQYSCRVGVVATCRSHDSPTTLPACDRKTQFFRPSTLKLPQHSTVRGEGRSLLTDATSARTARQYCIFFKRRISIGRVRRQKVIMRLAWGAFVHGAHAQSGGHVLTANSQAAASAIECSAQPLWKLIMRFDISHGYGGMPDSLVASLSTWYASHGPR